MGTRSAKQVWPRNHTIVECLFGNKATELGTQAGPIRAAGNNGSTDMWTRSAEQVWPRNHTIVSLCLVIERLSWVAKLGRVEPQETMELRRLGDDPKFHGVCSAISAPYMPRGMLVVTKYSQKNPVGCLYYLQERYPPLLKGIETG